MDIELELLKILKDTKFSQMMSSSEFFKQAQKLDIDIEDFSGNVVEMTRDSVIHRKNDLDVMKGKDLSLIECIPANAHYYCIVPRGLRLLRDVN